MARFSFKAVDAGGREVTGSLEAPDLQAAAAHLRARRLLVLHLGSARIPGAARAVRLPDPRTWVWIRDRDRVLLFRQMALMLRSGLTLLQALQTASKQVGRRALARCTARMAAAIQRGASFSRALAAEGRRFDPLVVKLVETSEVSGEMSAVLDQAAAHIERRLSVRTRLISSLTYPFIVVLASVAVAAFLVVKVIPRFAGFFARRNLELPAMTRALLDVAAWVQAWGIWLVAAGGGVVITLVILRATPGGRLLVDGMCLRIPVVGRLLTVAAMSRLARTLGTLLQSGVTLLESLRVTRGVLGNHAVAARVEQAGEEVLAGRDLAASLTGAPVPSLVTQVVAVGERSGSLAEALTDLGAFYEQDLDASVRRMNAVVEPLLILIVGGLVGVVYVAFFQAVFQLVGS